MLNELERRVVDLTYENKATHLSSSLEAVNVIASIYSVMTDSEVFVLGNAHAAMALYAVLEKRGLGVAQQLYEKHGTHQARDVEHGIWVTGGSLGQAETLAVGIALADRQRNVYLLTSDGACAEGSVWEALRIARDQQLENLRITVLANGHGALGPIDADDLEARLNAFYPTMVIRSNVFNFPEWMQGLAGHYVVMNKEQYEEITK